MDKIKIDTGSGAPADSINNSEFNIEFYLTVGKDDPNINTFKEKCTLTDIFQEGAFCRVCFLVEGRRETPFITIMSTKENILNKYFRQV